MRSAIAITLATVIGIQVVGGTSFALFASFGSFALMVFVDFPGDRDAWAVSYTALTLSGAVMIVLGGWLLAAVICIPVALLVFPADDHDRMREGAADACDALADALRPAASQDAAGTASKAFAALQAQYRSTITRPVGLTAGSRALVRLVTELTWLTPLVTARSATAGSATPARPR
jgi:hypothetical protein